LIARTPRVTCCAGAAGVGSVFGILVSLSGGADGARTGLKQGFWLLNLRQETMRIYQILQVTGRKDAIKEAQRRNIAS